LGVPDCEMMQAFQVVSSVNQKHKPPNQLALIRMNGTSKSVCCLSYGVQEATIVTQAESASKLRTDVFFSKHSSLPLPVKLLVNPAGAALTPG
jgi:hypothetical protein